MRNYVCIVRKMQDEMNCLIQYASFIDLYKIKICNSLLHERSTREIEIT